MVGKRNVIDTTTNIHFFYVLIAVCIVMMTTACFGFDDEGFQYWSSAGTSFDIYKDWKVSLEEELRFGDDGGNLYYEHSDLGFMYGGLADWVDLGANFRLVYEKDSNDKWRRENRPHLNITFKNQIFGLDVSDRSRFEYRDKENKDDVWRYRNKVTVKLPIEITALKLKPYFADEFFVTLNDDNVDKNRFYSGVSLKLTGKIKANVYYLWQSSRSGNKWKDINALGTQLKIAF